MYTSSVVCYSTSGARASLSIEKPGLAATPVLEWNDDGGASASSYRYSFEPKLVLKIDHYLGDVLSGSIKLGFKSAVDLDECLACLPRGRELLKAIQAKNSAAPVEQA